MKFVHVSFEKKRIKKDVFFKVMNILKVAIFIVSDKLNFSQYFINIQNI